MSTPQSGVVVWLAPTTIVIPGKRSDSIICRRIRLRCGVLDRFSRFQSPRSSVLIFDPVLISTDHPKEIVVTAAQSFIISSGVYCTRTMQMTRILEA